MYIPFAHNPNSKPRCKESKVLSAHSGNSSGHCAPGYHIVGAASFSLQENVCVVLLFSEDCFLTNSSFKFLSLTMFPFPFCILFSCFRQDTLFLNFTKFSFFTADETNSEKFTWFWRIKKLLQPKTKKLWTVILAFLLS